MMIMANDLKWDERLNVDTNMPDFSKEDYENYGYEPTPYLVLEELMKKDYVTPNDTLTDYGCGKGRVEFFINNQVGCKVTGIDHDKDLIDKANLNLRSYGETENIKFIHAKAEEYDPDESNRFYFFNPFSVTVFRRVMEKIKKSQKENPRRIFLFFYYPTTEYRMYFENDEKSLELIDTIDYSETLNDFACKLIIFELKEL